jgi:hypothetical protein
MNTVDRSKHEPYQQRMPKTSALPVAGREAMPDPPSKDPPSADRQGTDHAH